LYLFALGHVSLQGNNTNHQLSNTIMCRFSAFIILLHLVSFSSSAQNPTTNPNVPWFSSEELIEAHDPTFIKDEYGTFTLLNTNNMLKVRQSTDMMHWNDKGNIVNRLPSWISNAGINAEDVWAPFIHYRDGQYWCYYSVSTFGSNSSAIGLATNKTLHVNSPDYNWVDQGMVFRSSSNNNYNAIDPEIITDQNGTLWMLFGSFWDGIKMIELDPSTGKQKSGATVKSLASRGGSGIEGPSIIEHNGSYFLFTAWDKCCAGTESTYKTMVGKSSSMTGTFYDKRGTSLLNGGGTQLMAGYGRYYGPGGGSAVEIENRYYFIHHYYNADENGFPRTQIREIVWTDDNWPIITQPYLGRHQSYEAEHAQLTNAVITAGKDNASNGEYVAYINYDDSKVLFHVNAQQAGKYILISRYAAGLGNASHKIVVNGTDNYEIMYAQTENWGVFPEGHTGSVGITLKKGYNTISFGLGTGLAELDRIDLIKHSDQIIEAGSYDNSNSVEYRANNNAIVLEEGKYVQYENILFNKGYTNIQLQTSGDCEGTISFGLNDLEKTTQEIAVSGSSVVNIKLNSTFESAQGVYDVYLQMESGSCAIDKFEFVESVEDCNGEANGNAYIDKCGTCVGGNTGLEACTFITIEAEDACSMDGTVDSDNEGFSGRGFVNTENKLGSFIVWYLGSNTEQDIDVNIAYSNGSGTDRNASLKVNGLTQIEEVAFEPTVSWTHWVEKKVTVHLQEGSNEISFESLTEYGGVNYDYISFQDGLGVSFSCKEQTLNQIIRLEAGWNLVSIAVEIENATIENVFPSATIVKNDSAFYNASYSDYFNTLKSISPGNGYFVYVDKAETINLKGIPVDSYTKTLQAGWNLIGIPWIETGTLEDAFQYFNCTPISIKDFESIYETGSDLNTLDSLATSKAYLLFVENECLLKYE